MTRTFKLPSGCDAKTVEIRELTNRDDAMVGKWIDLKREVFPIDSKDPMAVFQARRREEVRRSIVSVDGVKVNDNDMVPFGAFDTWRKKTMTAVMRFFDVVNGLDSDELEKCVAAGMEDLPEVPPARQAASTGKP